MSLPFIGPNGCFIRIYMDFFLFVFYFQLNMTGPRPLILAIVIDLFVVLAPTSLT